MRFSLIMKAEASSRPLRKRNKCWTFDLSLAIFINLLLFASQTTLATDGARGTTPDIRIIGQKYQTIREFRINGQLYMIKITPHKGLPYYLIDSNGDGSMDLRRAETDERILTPNWILLQWK